MSKLEFWEIMFWKLGFYCLFWTWEEMMNRNCNFGIKVTIKLSLLSYKYCLNGQFVWEKWSAGYWINIIGHHQSTLKWTTEPHPKIGSTFSCWMLGICNLETLKQRPATAHFWWSEVWIVLHTFGWRVPHIKWYTTFILLWDSMTSNL